MKSFLKKSLVLLVIAGTVLCAFGTAAFADTNNSDNSARDGQEQEIPNAVYEEIPEDAIKYESENLNFSTTDSTGKVSSTYIKDDPNNNAWAWNLGMDTKGIKGPISNKLTYFRSGGIGGTVDFKINVEKAGKYDFMWAFRPHEKSYCTVDILINGNKIETVSQNNGDVVQGTKNQASYMRTIRCNDIEFVQGENTVTFKMVAARLDGNMDNSGFTSDFIALVPRKDLPVKTPEILSGATGTYQLATNTDVAITTNVTTEELTSVKLGTKQLAKDTDYTVSSADGVTTITVKSVALEALTAGEYTITLETTLGNITANLTVLAAAEQPEDPDVLVTDKKAYVIGDPIKVTAIGKGEDWVGIYYPDAEHSLYWAYVDASADKGVGSGVEFDITNWQAIHKNNSAPTSLGAGTYIVRLMPDSETDVSKAIQEITITIAEKPVIDVPATGDLAVLISVACILSLGAAVIILKKRQSVR